MSGTPANQPLRRMVEMRAARRFMIGGRRDGDRSRT